MIQEEEKVNKEIVDKEQIRTDKPWLFKKGESGNPNGRPKETEERKIIKKVQREFVEDYKEKLEKALPKISPVLISLALNGNLSAIKEINDRVMGQPTRPIDITSGGESFIPSPKERKKANKALEEIND